MQHDVEAKPEGQDEEGVPGEEEDEAPHHLVEHRHVDVVAETSGEDRVGYIFIFPFPPIFGPVAYDGGPVSPLLRFYSILCSYSNPFKCQPWPKLQFLKKRLAEGLINTVL